MAGRAATSSNEGAGSRPLALSPQAGERTEPGPFAWQDGRRLWIMDGNCRDWVLAELLFEPHTCRYLEIRRSSYRWPREAAGAFLGRMIASGEGRAEQAARGLSEWISRVNES